MSTIRSITEDDRDNLGKILIMLARNWQALVDERMKPYGMSRARWTVLLALNMLAVPTPQTSLAKLVGVRGPTLVHMLDGLEKDGFVRRIPHAKDRRVKLVSICPKGLKLSKQLFQVADELEAEIMSLLSKDRLKHLRADLLKIRSHVSDLLNEEKS